MRADVFLRRVEHSLPRVTKLGRVMELAVRTASVCRNVLNAYVCAADCPVWTPGTYDPLTGFAIRKVCTSSVTDTRVFVWSHCMCHQAYVTAVERVKPDQ